MNLATIVGHLGGRRKGQFDEQDTWKDAPVESAEMKALINKHVEKLFAFVETNNDRRDLDARDARDPLDSRRILKKSTCESRLRTSSLRLEGGRERLRSVRDVRAKIKSGGVSG